ncbi:MAG: hypothetical protein ACRDWY_04635 [Actinomycetes bacterium]
MPDWQSYALALLVVGVLALLLRWAFGGRSRSLVERRARSGHEDEYGLLVAIASPGTFIEGEVARQRLEAAGIKAQLVTTADGPRLMVFSTDEARARRVLLA